MKEIKVKALTENLGDVLSFVDSILEEHGCSMKLQMQIDIAVEEIFVNIAHYAYGEETGDAVILAGVDDNMFFVTFSDSGMPYNPLEKEDPDTTLDVEERPIGGLGIYMVKKSMDKVEYEHKDGKNVFTIRKKLA